MNPRDNTGIVLSLWQDIDKAPWIKIESTDTWSGSRVRFKIFNEKTRAQQFLELEAHNMYRLDDYPTREYVVDAIRQALDRLDPNSVETGTGSFDVYREDRR